MLVLCLTVVCNVCCVCGFVSCFCCHGVLLVLQYFMVNCVFLSCLLISMGFGGVVFVLGLTVVCICLLCLRCCLLLLFSLLVDYVLHYWVLLVTRVVLHFELYLWVLVVLLWCWVYRLCALVVVCMVLFPAFVFIVWLLVFYII